MQELDKVLIKPNIDALDAGAQRVRRNLIATSVIAIVFVLGSDGIDVSRSSFLGLRFVDVNAMFLLAFMATCLFYFGVNFVWLLRDHLRENKLRLTGIAVPMARRASYASRNHELEPNVGSERQSTIYSWWKGIQRAVEWQKDTMNRIEDLVQKEELNPAVNSINSLLEKIEGQGQYIEFALRRYEEGFWLHQRSQLLRWIILEFLIPLILGLFAISLLALELLYAYGAHAIIRPLH